MSYPPPAKALAILERRKAVAERYLRGETQWEIARTLGVSQGQVSRDLKAIRQEWLNSSVCNFNELKAREIAKVDELERTYWAAWEESKKTREVSTTEKT